MKNSRFSFTSKMIGSFLLFASIGSVLAQSVNTIRDYMDAIANATEGQTVQNPYSRPISDILKILSDADRSALTFYLHGKERDAVMADDWNKVDRYQAFLTCITTGDCERVDTLQNQFSPSASAPPAEPVVAPEPSPTNTSASPEPNPTNTSGEPTPTNTSGGG